MAHDLVAVLIRSGLRSFHSPSTLFDVLNQNLSEPKLLPRIENGFNWKENHHVVVSGGSTGSQDFIDRHAGKHELRQLRPFSDDDPIR